MAVDSPKVSLGNKPGKTNWIERYHALEPHATNWIYRTAEHLKGKGMPDGIAIATAKNAALKLCSTGDLNFPGLQQANPGSRAEACAAIRKWEEGQAKAKAASDLTALEQARAIDLAASFIAYEAGERRSLPPGASAAYLELAEPTASDAIDLAGGKFIDKAIKRPGQLHRDLGVQAGKKIPRKRIVAALSHEDPKVRARARLALRLIAMRKGAS